MHLSLFLNTIVLKKNHASLIQLDIFIFVLIKKDRIVLGSDYPFPLGELNAGSLIESSKYSKPIKVS